MSRPTIDRGTFILAGCLLVARDEDAVRPLRQELRRGWARKDRVEFLETSVERWEPKVATHEEPHDP